MLAEGGLNQIGDDLGQFPNRIQGSGSSGIRLGTPANNGELNSVAGNTIRDNFGHGVHASHGEASSVEENNIVANVGDGVRIDAGAARAVVAGNHVGLRFTGGGVLLAEGNGGAGVRLAAQRARVHGNQIGSNAGDGVAVMSTGFDSALTANFIGTTHSYVDAGNGLAGARVAGNEIRIGSGVPTETPDVIGSNGDAGIILTGNDNYVVFNHIGIPPDGDDIGNGDAGVRDSGPGGNGSAMLYNTIGFNAGDGIAMTPSAGTGNQFPLNVLVANVGYGIDLGDDGPTANDSGDADDGPNRTMDHRDVESVETLPGYRIKVLLRMDSLPANQTYPLYLYFFPADDSGRRQSKEYPGIVPLLEPVAGSSRLYSIYRRVLVAVSCSRPRWTIR